MLFFLCYLTLNKIRHTLKLVFISRIRIIRFLWFHLLTISPLTEISLVNKKCYVKYILLNYAITIFYLILQLISMY